MDQPEERTAQIIPFPRGGRDVRRPLRAGRDAAPTLSPRADIEAGSAWYHQAALREAAADRGT